MGWEQLQSWLDVRRELPVYLQGIDTGEIIDAVHARRAPTIPVSVSLRL